MKNVIVLGAGHIGTVIAEKLSVTGNYRVTLADLDGSRLGQLRLPGVDFMQLDVQDVKSLHAALSDREIVVSACPFFVNVSIAQAAKACGVHYFDLTEDIGTARRIAVLAEHADRVRAAMRCGSGRYKHHWSSHGDRLRQDNQRSIAGRSPTALPYERPEIQPYMVDARTD